MTKKATAGQPPDKGTLLMFKSLTELQRHGFDQADYYHHCDTFQFTEIPMHAISFEEAEELVFQICNFDFQEENNVGVGWLIRLIAGIAAYEDHEYRQFCARRAIQEAFKHSIAGQQAVASFVKDINDKEEGGNS
jgi:hypothetical protein